MTKRHAAGAQRFCDRARRLADGLADQRRRVGQGGLAGRVPGSAQYWALYELAEKLVDLETAFRFWRFRHVTTVERIIGFKTGTGGTDGVSYLRKMLDVVLFPELFDLRTAL